MSAEKDLIELREMIDAAIAKQLPPSEQAMARAISRVVTGIAFDIGRIATAAERIVGNLEQINET